MGGDVLQFPKKRDWRGSLEASAVPAELTLPMAIEIIDAQQRHIVGMQQTIETQRRLVLIATAMAKHAAATGARIDVQFGDAERAEAGAIRVTEGKDADGKPNGVVSLTYMTADELAVEKAARAKAAEAAAKRAADAPRIEVPERPALRIVGAGGGK